MIHHVTGKAKNSSKNTFIKALHQSQARFGKKKKKKTVSKMTVKTLEYESNTSEDHINKKTELTDSCSIYWQENG